MKLFLGTLALVLNVVGYFPYISGILRRKVKPQRITWAIWSLLTIVTAINQVKNHGGYSSLFMVSTAILTTITFLLSLRRGMGGASAFDRICLVLALGLFIYWITVQETRISTLMAVIIDALGAIPTVIKTYHHPETEVYAQWSLAALSGLLTVFSVPRLDWPLIIYPAYVVLADSSVVSVKFFKDRAKRSK